MFINIFILCTNPQTCKKRIGSYKVAMTFEERSKHGLLPSQFKRKSRVLPPLSSGYLMQF